MSPPSSVHLRVVTAERDAAGRLRTAVPFDEMARAIVNDRQLIILRQVWPMEAMQAFRRAILDWSRSVPAWPQGVSASLKDLNFHRVDDGTIAGRMAHIFHQFGFGKLSELPAELRRTIEEIAGAMLALQNQLAGTEFQFGCSDFRIKAIRHPRGGGFLVPHTHPYLPQKVSIFLNLSEPGVDYHSGSARFFGPDKKWIDTYADFRCGDLLAWRYDMAHETTPVDPSVPLDWQAEDGLWIFAIEMVEAHGLSNPTNAPHDD